MARKTKDIEATEPAGDGLLIPGAIEPAPKGYTVLARRYRSRSFDELIGQESIARTLQNAISMGRTAHAYLFCGTRGVGKTSMARVFARALNASSDLQQAEAVGASILRGEDLDVIEIDGASNRGVDDARDLISKAGIAPARSPYRIYIIDEVHMLTTPAFNALLKTMEEPPSHVKFILCTTEPHKVPATIQSRCQRFDFKPIATGRIVEHLKNVLAQEGLQADDAAVHLVARLGNGSMRDALSLLDRLIAAASGTLTARLAEETLGLPDAALIAAVTAAAVAGDAKAGLQAGARLLESVARWSSRSNFWPHACVTCWCCVPAVPTPTWLNWHPRRRRRPPRNRSTSTARNWCIWWRCARRRFGRRAAPVRRAPCSTPRWRVCVCTAASSRSMVRAGRRTKKKR